MPILPRSSGAAVSNSDMWQMGLPYLAFCVCGPHESGGFLNLTQVFYHGCPAVPVGVIRVDVKRSLERSHAMFEVHFQKNLVNVGKFVQIAAPPSA